MDKLIESLAELNRSDRGTISPDESRVIVGSPYLHRLACPRFVTTSVVSEPAFPYNWSNTPADTPEKIRDLWHSAIASEPDHEADKENVVVVLLTTRLIPFGWSRISLGTINESNAHPREIIRPVIAGAAYGFVMIHNHPSGDPSPSRADEATTRRIVEAANLLQIRLIDHLIIGAPAPGRSDYYSFREAGIIT